MPMYPFCVIGDMNVPCCSGSFPLIIQWLVLIPWNPMLTSTMSPIIGSCRSLRACCSAVTLVAVVDCLSPLMMAMRAMRAMKVMLKPRTAPIKGIVPLVVLWIAIFSLSLLGSFLPVLTISCG